MTRKPTTFLALALAAALLTPAAFAATPEDLGKEIGELYVQALKDVVDLMEARPPATQLQPKVDVLKESYVVKLVALGRKKQALSDAEKATVDSELRSAMRKLPSEIFDAYAEGQRHYFSEEPREVADTIGEFNVITQYADFELLKKQAPKEAERLGID